MLLLRPVAKLEPPEQRHRDDGELPDHNPPFDVPPGRRGYGGGWHAVRDNLRSVGVYDTTARVLLAAGNIPPPRR